MTAQKDKGTAMILEILPGLFGIFGIGWIYSGNTTTGIILLVSGFFLIWGGYITLLILATAFTALTAGLGSFSYCLFCLIPVFQLIGVVVSASMLNSSLS